MCLRNQHLYNESLRLYLPERHDPRYQEFAAALPQYKERLEQQYPQVCSDCAPRARERIQQAGYVAKTDHIRRLMDATKSGGMAIHRRSIWRSSLILAGGLLWWGSVIAQLLWHLMGILSEQSNDGLAPDDDVKVNLPLCVQQARSQQQVNIACVSQTARHLPYILSGAALSLWWNPRLSERYFGRRRGRLMHLTEYYCHCTISLTARIVLAYLLSDPSTPMVRGEMYQGAHGFSAIFILATAAAAAFIVKHDTTTRVHFHMNADQILPNVPERQVGTPRPLRTGGMDIDSSPTSPPATTQGAPLHANHTTRPAPSKPTFTLPPSEDPSLDPDAMDWSPIPAPTSHNLRPRYVAPVQHQPSGPNPFAQKVPSAPTARMRHPREPPAPPPPFQKATDAQKQTFFAGLRPSRAQSEETDDDIAASFKPRRGAGSQRIDFNPAPAKLVLPQDRQDTGLEGLFDTVFSFRDEPAEVAPPAAAVQTKRQAAMPPAGVGGVKMFQVHRDEPGSLKWRAALLSVLMVGVLPALILAGVFWAVRIHRGSVEPRVDL